MISVARLFCSANLRLTASATPVDQSAMDYRLKPSSDFQWENAIDLTFTDDFVYIRLFSSLFLYCFCVALPLYIIACHPSVYGGSCAFGAGVLDICFGRGTRADTPCILF